MSDTTILGTIYGRTVETDDPDIILAFEALQQHIKDLRKGFDDMSYLVDIKK